MVSIVLFAHLWDNLMCLLRLNFKVLEGLEFFKMALLSEVAK